MKRLTEIEKTSTRKLFSILQERLNETADFANKIQEDPETGVSLCEIALTTKRALVSVRRNGSVSSVNGVRILLAGVMCLKHNPSIFCFTKDI